MKGVFFLLFGLAMGSLNVSYGQVLYSYVDQHGVQVFTNIPPVGKVSNLKTSGTPEPALAPAPASTTSRGKADAFRPLIEKYASDYNLHPSLIHSIIAQESGFNPKAVSPKGAQGLMQLMPATAEMLGVSNSFDPEQNIQGGVRHFRSLMDNFNNDVTLSLAAYNAGANLVRRLGRVPEIRETKDYVKSITKLYNRQVAGGASTTRSAGQADEEAALEPYAPTYRYVDKAGVLHVTNIPPLH